MMNKKRLISWVIAIIMLPVILVGFVGRLVYNYLESGVILYEHYAEQLEGWIEK